MKVLNPLSEIWSAHEVAVMNGLREWTVASEEITRYFSKWMGLPVSDTEALGQIVWAAQSDEPLTPTRLARQIGMTSGAVSVLIDRLERAGYVSRHRDNGDRRRVSLCPTVMAEERTERFLSLAGSEVAAATRIASESELRVVRAFLDRMTEAMAVANTRLRQTTLQANRPGK